MSKPTTEGTTIRVSDDTHDLLKDEKADGETFNETIRRLLDVVDDEYITAQESRKIANEQITERVLPKAQR